MEPLDCNLCLREVPLDEQHNSEGLDYVANYFGLECLARWQNPAPASAASNSSSS
jgi:adenine-specific DNA methylase